MKRITTLHERTHSGEAAEVPGELETLNRYFKCRHLYCGCSAAYIRQLSHDLILSPGLGWRGRYYLIHFVDGEIKAQKVKNDLPKAKRPGNLEAGSTFLSTHFTERKQGNILQFAWENSDGGSRWQQVTGHC